MAFPWAGVGAALGGLGSLASGLGFGSDNGPGLGGIVRKARRQGLHPLAVLGSPIAGNFATPSAPRDVGGAIAAAGSIASAFGDASDRRRAEREAADRLRRQDDLSVRQGEALASLYDAQRLELLSKVTAHTAASRSNSKRGTAAGTDVYERVPAMVAVTDYKGDVIGYQMNPDLAEGFDDLIPSALNVGAAAKTGLIGAHSLPPEYRANQSRTTPGFAPFVTQPNRLEDDLFMYVP